MLEISQKILLEADDYFKKRKYFEAVQKFEELFELEPNTLFTDNHKNLRNFISACLNSSQAKKAIDFIDTQIMNHSNVPQYLQHLLKASTHYHGAPHPSGRQGVIQEYQTAIRMMEQENLSVLADDKRVAWQYLGHSYSYWCHDEPNAPDIEERIQKAKEAFQKSLTLATNKAEELYHVANSFLNIAKSLKNAGKIEIANLLAEEAKEFALEAIRLGEKIHYIRNPLASYKAFVGELEAIDELYAMSLQCAGDNKILRLEVHWFYSQIYPTTEKQLSLCLKAIETYSDYAPAYLKIAKLYLKQEEYENATLYAKQYLDKCPTGENILKEIELSAERMKFNQISRIVVKNNQVSEPEHYHWTRLHRAVYNGNVDSVKSLLKQGEKVMKDDLGKFPHEVPLAARLQHDPDYLRRRSECEALANPNYIEPYEFSQSDYKWTALHRAVYDGNVARVKWLLSNGAQIIKDGKGYYPHQVTLYGPYSDNKDYLQRRESCEILVNLDPQVRLRYQLLIAAEVGDADEIERLCTLSDLALKEQYGINENPEQVRFSILHAIDERKKQQTMPGSKGMPLHLAAANGHLDALKRLIHYKAPINAEAEGTSKCTPLHYAVSRQHKELVRYLVVYGARVNFPDHTGNTSLHYAVRQNNLELVQLLLDHGADLHQKAALADGKDNNTLSYEFTPLELAQQIHQNSQWTENIPDRTEIMTMFANFANIASKNQKLFEAVRAGDIEKIDEALREGANINTTETIINRRDAGGTPLHIAAYNGNIVVLAHLLKKGAFINSRNTSSNATPLHFAAGRNKEATKFLTENKADLEARDHVDFTPLHCAVYRNIPGSVTILLNAGANIDAVTGTYPSKHHYKVTPLEMALSFCNDNESNQESRKAIIEILTSFKNKLQKSTPGLVVEQKSLHFVPLLLPNNFQKQPLTQSDEYPQTEQTTKMPAEKALPAEQQLQDAVQHFIEQKKEAEKIKVQSIKEKQTILTEDIVLHFIDKNLQKLGINTLIDKTKSFADLGCTKEQWKILIEEIEVHFMIVLDNPQELGRITDIITRSKEKIEASQCLVRWRSNRRDADKKPAGLFLIHPIMGGISEYRTLCENLNSHILEQRNLALYIFRSPILDLDLDSKEFKEDYPTWCTLEYQAEIAIKAMKAVQPHGPYYICGWSYGGVLTIEIARQLKIANEKVKFIGLVDPQVPDQLRALDKVMLINRLLMHINYISSVTLVNKKTLISEEILKEVQAEGQTFIQAAFEIAFQSLNLENIDPGYKKLRAILYTLQANYLAAYGYFPELKEHHKLDRVVVYIAGEKAEFLPKPEYSLNDLMPYLRIKSAEPITEYTNHFDIVTKAQFANMLMRHIDDIGTIKLEEKMMFYLGTHYHSLAFSTMQFFYDDVRLQLSECEFNVQNLRIRTLNLAQLFVNGANPKHIIISGKSGSGKSSLARKLALDNLHGQVWQEKRWVFYLSMRNVLNYIDTEEHPIRDNNACIETMLYHAFFKVAGMNFKDVQTAWLDIKKSPKQVCILIDEIEDVLEQAELEFLFKALFKSDLTVVVCASELHFKRLKHLGFTADHKFKVTEIIDDDYIKRFIQNYFQQMEEEWGALAGSLCEAIEASHYLKNLSRNPLYLSQLCAVWRHIPRQDSSDLSIRQLTQILVENAIEEKFIEHSHLSLADDMHKRQTLVFEFLNLCAYRIVLANSHSISSKEMQILLREFNQGTEFIKKILATGFLVPIGFDTPWPHFEFNNLLMQLYFASEYFIVSIDRNKIDDKLLTFIETGINNFESDLFCEFILSPLKEKPSAHRAAGIQNLLNRLGEIWKNGHELKKIQFLSRVTEIVLSMPLLKSTFQEQPEIIESIAPVLYCFTSNFARAYPMQDRKDQADVESEKLFIYKEAIEKLKMECPKLFIAVEEIAKVEYSGKERVLHYAVKKQDRTLIKLLLTLGADPESRNDEGLRPIDIAQRTGFNDVADLITQARERNTIKCLARSGFLSIDKKHVLKGKEFEGSRKYVHEILTKSNLTNEQKVYVNQLKDEIIKELLELWINRARSSFELDNYIKNMLESYNIVKTIHASATVAEKAEFYEVCQYIKGNLLKIYVKDKKKAENLLIKILELGQYKNLKPILSHYMESKREELHVLHPEFYREISNILVVESRILIGNPGENARFALDKIIEHSSQSKVFKQFVQTAVEQCIEETLMIECFDANISLFLEVVLDDYRNKTLMENSELKSNIEGFLKLVCDKCYSSEIEKEIMHRIARDLQNETINRTIFSF